MKISQRARWLSQGLLVAISSTFIFLVLAEGLLMLRDFYLVKRYGPWTEESVLWTYDKLLGWKMQPNKSDFFSNPKERFKILCQTNSHGLRDDEMPYQKPPGTRRILLLGDSVVAGFEVEKEKVIDSVLEKFIRPITPCEVINAGVRGYGTDQSYLFLIHEGIKYDPDIVLYVLVGNDPEENIAIHRSGRKYGKSYFVYHRGKLVLKGVPVPPSFDPPDQWLMSSQSVQDFYNNVLYPREIPKDIQNVPFFSRVKSHLYKHSAVYREVVHASGNIPPAPQPLPPFVREYRRQVTKGLIQNMKSFCDEKGVLFAVYRFTNGVKKSPAQEKDREELLSSPNIETIESRELFFRESGGGKKFCFSGDPHWNAKGHALAAKIIFEYLKEKRWL